ncbi:MAG: acetyl-CoA carboxylase biotin carboxylase subunit [Desulfobacula sp.]|uniref:acetyl-CoA carboxylase biotin carboxylase subunit n=1 Tax=Desulfobacula sp. TaxID=2593537 RepID=UPI001D4069A8|nr:acetyl-CoA carboxylase biotin carboxylase subunit [Desulfobacula sp.]MBT3807143.1 acetyl-CoA carboxylase biotin carboxylase subunit [Desulfobacula sp.]MBT4027273.1 acetyl-CoA carboxylase biotin carboxylase subunit [Desulfobacula sp.]MBT4199910.1 acetyl-CoA carboxylase biotin carboxylase subunit [Desulfobacula sp.]MBT4507707.1 acetyl-CoA carboxylase biotin carboxylase subunit [Desulfobacula sp.]
MLFKSILIANRGEIAVRVIRACKEMGIKTIAVFSDADKDSLHVKYADDAVHIGPALSRKSYLNIDNIIGAAKKTNADAIHPGYGFLSENFNFAKACFDNHIIFIGPSAQSIAKAGDKSAARQTLMDLGIPIIPGSDDILSSSDMACKVADTVGYPVILKAAGGGGGRGMRIASNKEELITAFSIASGEAKIAFGNPDIYLEKYIEKPRHIEIQILGDHFGNYIHLAERECSIQLRYQKLIEESPSSFVDENFRVKLGKTAIRIAKAFDYTNAGTMEFLVDKNKNFYFMEVNARVQVEHPVTELVTGVDIVQQQILIAAGEKLDLKQEDIHLNGWSMECRINATDPNDNFMPSPGQIESILFPGGPGIRIDTHIHDKYMVTPFYDSLIGKLIVWAKDRPAAINRMSRALSEFEIKGIETTIGFYKKVFKNDNFQKGDIDTHFLERI